MGERSEPETVWGLMPKVAGVGTAKLVLTHMCVNSALICPEIGVDAYQQCPESGVDACRINSG